MADIAHSWVGSMRGGRYEDAWEISQRALGARDPTTRDDPSLPYHLRWVWDGRSFDGKHVLVRCYQGLGDTIQFARFLPLLAARAASVAVEVHPRLHGLLAGIPGVSRLIAFDPAAPAPPSECDIEITELAFALRAPPSSAPPPYLRAGSAPLPGGTVAICYDAGEWDRERCVPAELFGAICDRRTCITLVPEPTTLPVLNREGCPFDMDQTASLVASASLVITVDTMVAHLAGALGRPTWLLLKAEPDWRWSPEAEGSDWYPSMRQFVQPRPGDWAAVMAQVERALADVALAA
jgi:hypothetical protein